MVKDINGEEFAIASVPSRYDASIRNRSSSMYSF